MDELIKIIETKFNYPVYRQGSAPQTYPESFFCYWNIDSDDTDYANNLPTAQHWEYYFYFYTADIFILNTTIKQLKKLLKSKGFTVSSNGTDLKSDYPTHVGKVLEAVYYKKL